MKKLRILLILLIGSTGTVFAQSADAVAGGKMTTGLSIAVIVLLGLVIYSNVLLTREKKMNQTLSHRIHELEQKNS